MHFRLLPIYSTPEKGSPSSVDISIWTTGLDFVLPWWLTELPYLLITSVACAIAGCSGQNHGPPPCALTTISRAEYQVLQDMPQWKGVARYAPVEKLVARYAPVEIRCENMP